MNQSTSNTKSALEGAANGEASGKAAAQPRRYRRPSRAKSPAASQAATTTSTATPAAPTDTPPPAKPTSGRTPAASKSGKTTAKTASGAKVQPEAAATPPPPKAAEPAEPRPRTRTQRNTRRSKGDVHLVVPPSAAGPGSTNGNGNGGQAASVPIPPEAFALPAPVPVLTVEPSAAEEHVPAVSPDQTQSPEREGPTTSTEPTTASRYRFDRRAAAVNPPPQQTIRPERLSGLLSNPPAPASAAATTVPETPTEAPEAESEPFDLFGTRPAGTFSRTSAGDDILSELGLREANRQATEAEEEEQEEEPEPFVDEAIEDRNNHAAAVAPEQPLEAEAEELPEAESPEGDAALATRRRRRRRRSSPHVTTPGEETTGTAHLTEPSWPAQPLASATTGAEAREIPPAPAGRGSPDQYSNSSRPAPAEPPAWDISTAQQYIRREDSPFGAPAPSFAKGFGPQPRGVSSSTSSQNLYSPRPTRTERGTDTPPMSPNQLANMVASTIAQQTDRLLTELRYQQHPPSMTVMFPPLPSTERVGIFVDVANLMYSSRSLRINIDFGRLLEFLRGNRRLIRAHAYAPTNPDPGADQTFLSAVKGMGYRITTKNYKTFSSGAKKADMDLDLCMDIVRLVDAGALDTVVLVSGDSDFLPLLEYCSDHGVRVEAAAFDDSAAMILRQSCDLFINLTLAADIRA